MLQSQLLRKNCQLKDKSGLFFNDLKFTSELLRITQNCNNIGSKSNVPKHM